MEKLMLKIKGMHCKSCELIIKESLEELPGITNVTADHTKGTVQFDFDAMKGKLPEVKRVIIKEGYAL